MRESFAGKKSLAEPSVRDDQARIVWVELEDSNLAEGSFVKADIEVATIDVPLAVKRVGLQGFETLLLFTPKWVNSMKFVCLSWAALRRMD